ncbi:MAG: response regulator [Methanothrix sp.]|nr:MAG: response regulator [Methanothrix sp.]
MDLGCKYNRKVENLPLILLVEDDATHAMLIMRTFGRLDLPADLDWVKDGEEALNYLHKYEYEKDHRMPNLIILDLRLPKLDGHEVLREIKHSEELSTIPVVILSTSKVDEDILKAYTNRADGYLVKPVDFDKLQKMIKYIYTNWIG